MSKQDEERLLFGDLVSVIMLIDGDWQAAKESLESVYQQTYQNIELILLNGPKNSCWDYIQQWLAEKNASKRFHRVILKKNQQQREPYKIINDGLSQAEGKALTILSSGDAYMTKRIEILMQAAESYNSTWLITGIQAVDATGARANTDLAIEIEACVDYAAHFPAVSFAVLKKNIAVTAGNLFFSHDLYHKVGGLSHLQHYYDWDFALQACLISEPCLIPEPLYRYRVQPNRAFTAQTSEQSLEQKIIYRHYFAACHAGHGKNSEAPWLDNWPGLFACWVAEDQELKQVYDLLAQSIVKYDQLTKTLINL